MVKVFLDSADLSEIRTAGTRVKGFTCNPSLMRAAGVKDYKNFARAALEAHPGKPLSLEVIADGFHEMEHQARRIASWGENVFVKIPITNTKGQTAAPLIKALSDDGVKVNVTAILSYAQVDEAAASLSEQTPGIISVFAGRIADTGRNPRGAILHAVEKKRAATQVLWASTRQVLDVYTADELGCDIITLPQGLLAKLALEGKNLEAHSLDTVRMFYSDARAAGYSL